MYYIYHIPGVKIGCSINPTKRVKSQKHTHFEILEQWEDKDVASMRERELQEKWGYRVDNISYSGVDYTKIGKLHTIPIIATNLKSGLQKEFHSLTECAKEIGIGVGRITHILSPKYKRKSTYGWTLSLIHI